MPKAVVRAATLSLLALLPIPPAPAATVVVPNFHANVFGYGGSLYPYGSAYDVRFQQVFPVDQMGALAGVVTKIAYRVDEHFPIAFSFPIDFELRLCHTTAAPGAMDPIFANNLGPDVTLVHAGYLELSSPGNPSAFDIVIDISDVFVYDGVSNLLLDLRKFNSTDTTPFDWVANVPNTRWTAYALAVGVNSPVATWVEVYGPVTQFTIEGATAVAPTTWGGIKLVFADR